MALPLIALHVSHGTDRLTEPHGTTAASQRRKGPSPFLRITGRIND
jgi:hypothetical protein